MHHSQVLLPPQEPRKPWSHCSKTVVGIHKRVYEAVHDRHEGPVVRGVILQTYPADSDHERVVVHVEKRHLAVLLADHEEYRVPQVEDLGRHVFPVEGGD